MSDEWNFVVAAYALTWITFFGYLAYLHARLKRSARELDAELDEREEK